MVVGDAFKTCETALEVAPDDLAAIEGLASLALRTGRDEPRLRGWLEQITLGAADTPWAIWAQTRLASQAPTH
jgi:hypothetical protein